MAIGTAAFVLYLVFLVWTLVTAPAGPNSIPETGPPYTLAATLISGLEIHDFAAQNVLKVADKSKYQLVIKASFLMGFGIFLLCSLGSICNLHTIQLSLTDILTLLMSNSSRISSRRHLGMSSLSTFHLWWDRSPVILISWMFLCIWFFSQDPIFPALQDRSKCQAQLQRIYVLSFSDYCQHPRICTRSQFSIALYYQWISCGI